MSAQPATSTPDWVTTQSTPLRLERATVAVLMGGRSNEREVSLLSGRMVLEALTRREPGDERGPERVLGIEVQADGRWRVGQRELPPGEAVVALGDVDVFFSALHGGEGENGALQGLLTCSDRPFTGSGVIASAVAMDKAVARVLVHSAGLRIAAAVLLSRSTWREESNRRALTPLLEAGCVVKPRRGGSSVGCSIVRGSLSLEQALERAFLEEPEVLVEALVQGVEATCAVVETPDGVPRSLPPVEIRPRGAFFDYHEKYDPQGALEICPPTGLDASTCERLQNQALLAHRVMGCGGYSRTDFIVPADGEPVFLESNTLPGLTPRSLLPLSAAAVGLDYRTLCLWIAANGITRNAERRHG